MAVIKSFQAWRYNSAKFSHLEELVVPPYDVISPKELEEMQRRNKHNYSNIILNQSSDKYQAAANLLNQWCEKEDLVQDEKLCLYFYRQTFKLKPTELFCQNVPDSVKRGGALSRIGFFTAVGLEDYSAKVILPHEKTFSSHKDDRYKLMQACQGNMEPVFLGFDSEEFNGASIEKFVSGRKATVSYKDDSGVLHEMWAVSDAPVVQEVETALLQSQLFILDGHHRYETALKFYNDHKNKDARLSHRYVLANVCAFRQPGVVILPTHRALKKVKVTGLHEISSQLGEFFEAAEMRSWQEVEGALMNVGFPSFGLVLQGGKFAVLKGKPSLERLTLNTGFSKSYEQLDLVILHEFVLKQLGAQEEDIDYIKDIDQVIQGAGQNLWPVSFLVRPNAYQDVMGVARRGEKMPHKSTFFYPKIPSGLVVRRFD